MKTAICSLTGTSPFSSSKFYQVEKLAKEGPDDYEKRTWRERCHATSTGYVEIPPMMFKNMLSAVAKYLSKKIPGKRNSTYTKHFEAGLMVLEGITLSVKKENVEGEWLFVPSDGKRGGGSRVMRCFPVVREWSGKVEVHVLDETITKDVFVEHLVEAGKFIGLGRFRPANNGFYGRFRVDDVQWVEG